jgi:hypothetical protein
VREIRGSRDFKNHSELVFLVLLHIFFAFFLGRLFALAPDEEGYLATFNKVYTLTENTNAQGLSGWITSPTVFLWVVYLPSKILNLVGVADYLSVRILSILLVSVAFYLLKSVLNQSKLSNKRITIPLLLPFFIPSVFFWTSIGLRESFIILEMTLFLVGLNFIFKENLKRGVIFMLLGSYGLISTKTYLWVCLEITVLLFCLILLFRREFKRFLQILLGGLAIPLLIFTSTTSSYALDFIFNSNVLAVGARSGDSITTVVIDVPTTGTGTTGTGTTGTGTTGTGTTGTGTTGTGTTGTGTTGTGTTTITFHGDYTLVALHDYLKNHPNTLFSRSFKLIQLDHKVDEIWSEKITVGLISEDRRVGSDDPTLTSHILEPGNLNKPISMLTASANFLFGPLPFHRNLGFAASLASFESPLWWFFYGFIAFTLFKLRTAKLFQDPLILFSTVFILGLIACSAIIEVNLGTSFRHRSILVAPLLFLYVRAQEKFKVFNI